MLPFHKCCRLGGQDRIYEINGSVTRLPNLVGQVSEIRSRRESKVKYQELTNKIIDAVYTVHNTLGFGFLEKVYPVK